MNKMDLIAAVADGTDLSRAKAGEVVDAVFGAITGALKAKEEVRLVGNLGDGSDDGVDAVGFLPDHAELGGHGSSRFDELLHLACHARRVFPAGGGKFRGMARGLAHLVHRA